MKLPWLACMAILLAMPLSISGKNKAKDSVNPEDNEPVTMGEVREFSTWFVNRILELASHSTMQNFFVTQKSRTDGDSGIKVGRHVQSGPENYFSGTHITNAMSTIHDHSNYVRTLGMGEVHAILNGEDFTTRHNDYKLKMAHTKSKELFEAEDISFPEVPPKVLKKTSVEEQIAEMTEWFRAFAEQNYTVRDYRKYFKPVMCYLEGVWLFDEGKVVDAFESTNHHLDAETWDELLEAAMYNIYTGKKDIDENVAWLPTRVVEMDFETGMPIYGQYNYRIMCRPSPIEVPTRYMRQMEDIAHRFPRQMSKQDVKATRAARFRFYEFDKDRFTKFHKLDEVFMSIPGLDNVPKDLKEPSAEIFRVDTNTTEEMNTGFYHRFYEFAHTGAMGTTGAARGFNDPLLFFAQNSQEKVAGRYFPRRKCAESEKSKYGQCIPKMVKYSWAVPLEIVYLTPLLTWNPYALQFREDMGTVGKADGRDGKTAETAYDGTFEGANYHVPAEFFTGKRDMSDPADTVEEEVWVQDTKGVARRVKASGTSIILPKIGDIEGNIRLRYPIAPVSGEGHPGWKELNAFRVVMQARFDGAPLERFLVFEMSTTVGIQSAPAHSHDVLISETDVEKLREDSEYAVTVVSSKNIQHTHTLIVKMVEHRFQWVSCDGQEACWDGHSKNLISNE